MTNFSEIIKFYKIISTSPESQNNVVLSYRLHEQILEHLICVGVTQVGVYLSLLILI